MARRAFLGLILPFIPGHAAFHSPPPSSSPEEAVERGHSRFQHFSFGSTQTLWGLV